MSARECGVASLNAEADDTTAEQPTDDRPFEPFRAPRSEAVRAIVADVQGQVQTFERIFGLRQRQRRRADQATFETTVAALICDAIHRALTCPEGWVSLSLSHQHLGRAGRYRAPTLTKALPAILDRLSAPEMGFLVVERGYQGHFGPARRTVFQAAPRLRSWTDAQGIGLDDLTVLPTQETIILKREKTGFWDDGERVEYEDSELKPPVASRRTRPG